MGTNYYVAKDKCNCCGRYDKEYHIGKSSYGWAFSFEGYPHNNLTSWADYKNFLKDKTIVDEYGSEMSYIHFVEIVEGVKSPHYISPNGHKNLSHHAENKAATDWEDEAGYSFTTVEFS